MKDLSFSWGLKTGVGLLLMLLVGCVSNAPSRYYILTSLSGENKVQVSEGSCIRVGIGPIKLPEYVNRLQIVIRTTPNELILSNFDLWSEPLADSVPRMLGENISRLVCVKEVSFFPWKSSRAPDYRVEAEVLSMDGNLGTAVNLEVWWTISLATEKTARIIRRSQYNAPAAGKSYETLVQAYSQTLGAFSRDIADALRELNRQNPQGK